MTHVKDISHVFQQLREHQELVIASTDWEVTEICADTPALRDSVLSLLTNDRSSLSSGVYRLLPWPVAGALGADPNDSLLACVLSRLWWAGADTLDDLVNGGWTHESLTLSSTRATISSISCLTMLSENVVARQGLSAELERDLRRELSDCARHAADRYIVDVPPLSRQTTSWKEVIRSYAAKTGAVYARDIAMTARLVGATEEDIHRWRVFGTVFGVLRQLADDRVKPAPDKTGDPGHMTTPLLAHTAETRDATGRAHLHRTAEAARFDEDAQAEFSGLVHDPANLAAYNARIESLVGHLSRQWQGMAGDSDYGDLVHWMLQSSVDDARMPGGN